jgi:phosphotransacetylase
MEYDEIRIALLQRLARGTPPTAIVVSPYTPEIISAVQRALRDGIVGDAILVGDPAQIPLARADAGTRLRFQPLESEEAVLTFVSERLWQGDGNLVVKGSISSGKLLRTVLAAGAHPDDRLSHIYVIDSSAFPGRAVVFSDAGVNIAPDLQTKEKIIDNVVHFAHNIGYAFPRIAVLSAVETLNPAIQSTVDAAALKAMGERGRFGRCHVDGPMALDAAMIPRAAAAKSLTGEVAGRADILICPEIDGANSTAKALIGTTGRAMGVIYGGRGVPIAFPSRGDSEETRLGSILLAAGLACQAPVAQTPATTREAV